MFQNENPRKPKGVFESIRFDDPDPNVMHNERELENWEKRYFLMLPREREQARRNNRLLQGGIITDPRFTKNEQTGELIDDIVFTDPYPAAYKSRLANSYEFDSIIRTGIDTLVHYILGRDFEPRLRPVTRKKPRVEEELEAIMDPIISKQEREQFMDYVNYVDHTTKLKLSLKPLLVSKYVFGRSAALLVRASDKVESDTDFSKIGFKEDTPMHIKPLNSYYLGQNHYNTKTWEVVSIEYDNPNWIRDRTKSAAEQPPLDIEDLMYFTHADHNIIPNSFGYGMSALENILALSGANRRINERVFPELNTAAWAGSGIFKFVGMSAKQMANFVKSILPSTWKATNQELQYIPIKLEYDGEFLLDQRDSNVKHIATQLRIPSFLINFEDVTNRSVGDRVSNIWQQGDLEFARDELRDQLWEFWYRRLMELYFPDKEFLYIKTKIMVEFQSIDFSNFFEKAIAAGNLVQNGISTISEAREFLGRPPYPEDQQEFMDLVEKYLANNPDIAQMLSPNSMATDTNKEGTIGQQGLSTNVNPNKVKSGDFDSGDVVNRVKKGVRQPKNFR